MLQELSIKDFAIIEDLQVDFDEGMTVLTGETGAGKSIVIDALGLLVGGRGSTEFIRNQANKCQLQALFTLPSDHIAFEKLVEFGIDVDEGDGQIIIQRDIFQNGKNVCRINGRLVNITILKELGKHLVDIQGQHDGQMLLQPENHLLLLDKYAGITTNPDYLEYQQVYANYEKSKNILNERQQNEQAYIQRLDMLNFQMQEIAEAELEVGEEEQLQEEKNKLDNFRYIAEELQLSKEALEDDNSGVMNALSIVMGALDNISSYSKTYEQLAETVTNAYYSLQDVASEVDREQDLMEMDEERQNYVDNRLLEIKQLERKYGEDVEAILAYYETISKEYEELIGNDQNIGELEVEVKALEEQAQQLAMKISKLRKQAAKKLATDIDQQLAELYMSQAEFEVNFKEKALTKAGIDEVEFYMATNAGEAMKPLAKVVSGGELSRIVLALKTIFTSTNGITSIVFDEVDTGVSGRVAQAIAEKIHAIGLKSQVLCITHLPQVAAIADHHYYIQKQVVDGRTFMQLQLLSENERIIEIARMLAGSEVTELTLEHAKELLTIIKKENKA